METEIEVFNAAVGGHVPFETHSRYINRVQWQFRQFNVIYLKTNILIQGEQIGYQQVQSPVSYRKVQTD